MKQIGSFEARTHFYELLERVAKGESLTITKHGVPVAMLVPVSASPRGNRGEIIDRLLEFGKGRRLRGLAIRRLIEEGRRS